MNYVFKTSYNRVKSPRAKESHPGMISKTIPDQSLTVREIMQRHVQGIPINASMRTPVYDGEEFVPDFVNMDLADRQTLMEAAREELAEIRKRANEKALKVKEKREADAIQKAYERLKREGKIGLADSSEEGEPKNPT